MSTNLDPRRKRLLFRSCHRGMKETDLMLGRFAEHHLAILDDGQLDRFATLPDLLAFPAWDCLPYDRVSPNSQLVSRRLDTLTRLASPVVEVGRPRIVISTVAAILQRVPTRKLLGPAVRRLRLGDQLDGDELIG